MWSKHVQRDLQINSATGFGLGKLAGADIDLDGGQNERWHIELGVAAFSKGLVFLFCGAFA